MNRRVFLAATAATVVSRASAAAPKEKVKIVSSLPRTGSAQGQTDQIANAIRMAIADFEKVVPFAVEYLDWDDATAATGAWTAEKERENADAAVADADVMAVIGPYNSGAARISSPILNKAGLVQVTPAATWPGLTKKDPGAGADEPKKYRPGKAITFCRVCPHDGSQGPQSADFAAEELKAKTVYILDDKEGYGQGIAASFKKRCEELKIKVLASEGIDPLQRDFKALMRKIKKAAPDLVYFGGTGQSGGPRIAIDMRGEKLDCPLMVPDGCYERLFIEAAGADTFDSLKCFVALGSIDPTQLKGAGADFVKRYKEKHEKGADVYAPYGYEAAAVVLEALCVAGKKDREAVRKAVVGTKDFGKGVLGKWSFNADGDTTLQQTTISTIEQGKFRPVKIMGMK